MPFEFGDVVLVPFPFTNQNSQKQRPAVVISPSVYSQSRPDIIVMAVTSQMHPALGYAETLLNDWQKANLLKPSLIKPVIATLEQNLIIKKLGQLSAQDQKSLRFNIEKVIG